MDHNLLGYVCAKGYEEEIRGGFENNKAGENCGGRGIKNIGGL